MVSVLEALSGVSVASVSGDRLETRLTTRIDPSQPPPPGLLRHTLTSCIKLVSHNVSVALQALHQKHLSTHC